MLLTQQGTNLFPIDLYLERRLDILGIRKSSGFKGFLLTASNTLHNADCRGFLEKLTLPVYVALLKSEVWKDVFFGTAYEIFAVQRWL